MDWNALTEQTESYLEGLRMPAGMWEGRLSSSALSTATAMVALRGVDAAKHAGRIEAGARWLIRHQNADGGWGDTPLSRSNLSTTLLCWSALSMLREVETQGEVAEVVTRAERWISERVGSLDPAAIQRSVVARYGKDKTFSVPILMLCAICGTLGADLTAGWRRVLPLPFELAALPRQWFGAVGLPVVSYALPALIAIGYARHANAPMPWWNPLRLLRVLAWEKVSPMLRQLQPASGGYLEATPLTSFVTMALASAGEREHPCVAAAVRFLEASMREDGSWPIDTNLATWGTTLAIKNGAHLEEADRVRVVEWLLRQQYQEVHPFTGAAPGGWAWTDLPGGVPDADDTPGALMALHRLAAEDPRVTAAAARGIRWLLDLQNRDGGMPTFCRGWGTLPFDRSTPELTAHALAAWWLWKDRLGAALRQEVEAATVRALRYLERQQRKEGEWVPLWFGNENAREEENPVYGTAQVINGLCACPSLAQQAAHLLKPAAAFLQRAQCEDGGWGGEAGCPATVEETAVVLQALARLRLGGWESIPDKPLAAGVRWLCAATAGGTVFPEAPIGLYFARLWYHEQLYPVVWTLGALKWVRETGISCG